MALHEDLINGANEWQIRSLIDRTTFPVEGQLQDLLTPQEIETRMPREIDRKFSSHRLLGDAMVDNYSRLDMSITDMVTRHQAEEELLGGSLSADFSWLKIPGDEDKFFIVLIIRKFLKYQKYVHRQNMSRPSDEEKSDYRVLQLIHNYLLTDAEDWLKRVPPEFTSKKEDVTLMDILNAGGIDMHEQPVETRTLDELTVEDDRPFSGLSSSSAGW